MRKEIFFTIEVNSSNGGKMYKESITNIFKERVIEVKEFKAENDANSKVESIIYEAMNIYVSRLMTGYFELGLEATFQLHFSRILEDLLLVNTVQENERYQVLLEKNLPLDDNKNYVDIVIKHKIDNQEYLYLIELKYKKITDSATDLGNIMSYIDMFNLECHKKTNTVKGCYFIFLTDLQTYVNEPKKGTRTEVPMHDNYTIKKDKTYNVQNESAKKAMGRFLQNGFTFSSNHKIEYTHFKIDEKDYWYFIEKI
ncbi:MAG: hypothetical protein SO253_00730 [Bacilli bacterium]|nr:hypothetical protein [Bacilli bacterium]